MQNQQPFAHILLLKHHRHPSERLLGLVADLVRRSRARLTFAHTLEGGDQLAELSQHERLRELEDLMAPHADGLAVDYRLMTGDLAAAAESAAAEFDLIVPAEGRPRAEAARRELVRLLRRSPLPVWVDGGAGTTPRGILAAVDVQTRNPLKRSLNLPILRRAIRLAELFDAQLNVLTVRNPPATSELLARRLAGERSSPMPGRRQARDLLRALLAEARGDGGETAREPRLMVAQGDPDRLIRQAAESDSVDLLVAGSLGRTGLAAWLVGDTTERLSRDLTCSILAVKPTQQQLNEAVAAGRSRAA